MTVYVLVYFEVDWWQVDDVFTSLDAAQKQAGVPAERWEQNAQGNSWTALTGSLKGYYVARKEVLYDHAMVRSNSDFAQLAQYGRKP